MGNGLAGEAIGILRGKFMTVDAAGPVWAASVAASQAGGGRDYEQVRRAAFENAQELFRLVAPETPAGSPG
jgi:hypothetical protein